MPTSPESHLIGCGLIESSNNLPGDFSHHSIVFSQLTKSNREISDFPTTNSTIECHLKSDFLYVNLKKREICNRTSPVAAE